MVLPISSLFTYLWNENDFSTSSVYFETWLIACKLIWKPVNAVSSINIKMYWSQSYALVFLNHQYLVIFLEKQLL